MVFGGGLVYSVASRSRSFFVIIFPAGEVPTKSSANDFSMTAELLKEASHPFSSAFNFPATARVCLQERGVASGVGLFSAFAKGIASLFVLDFVGIAVASGFTAIFSSGLTCDCSGVGVGAGGLVGSGVADGVGVGMGDALRFGAVLCGVGVMLDLGRGVGSIVISEVGSLSGRLGASCARTDTVKVRPTNSRVQKMIFIPIPAKE